ncbi:phage protein [Paenibacillus glycanilyticus]|uniref:Phage protein n=1 Tax=Paenibacillus glycanilyticus TaxID=126569 RepID=A0ABQ6NKZ6_9BACL|nr:hemolysin XhlA family protein [Paenibacillus glycanilyticus]GMK45233.1 phage protein [Paenibacillus glycanilyticus]
MPADETNEILQRLVRLETKLDLMGTAKDVANEALVSAKSANHRLSAIEDNQKWLWRTVIGALIAGAIAVLWKGVGI